MASQEDNSKILSLSHIEIDIFIIPFPHIGPTTPERAQSSWFSEIDDYEEDKTLTLVGMNGNLRDEMAQFHHVLKTKGMNQS
jgi:hypothetical protein